MIQILWIIGLSLTVLALLLHFGFVRKKSNRRKSMVLVQFSNRQKWIFKITILSMIVLMITGANAVIFSGQHLTGLGLLIHLSFAPVFAIGLAILVFQWAHVFQFVEGKNNTLSKILFWLLSALVLPVVLSIILSMQPFFGTEGQHFLSELHRVSSLFLVIAAILFLYFIFVNRRSKSSIN